MATIKERYLAAQQQIKYEGNKVLYYPFFDLYPTGDEENIVEDEAVEVVVYDGGSVEGW